MFPLKPFIVRNSDGLIVQEASVVRNLNIDSLSNKSMKTCWVACSHLKWMKHIQNITQATNQFIVALHRKDVKILYHAKHAYNKTPAASMLCKGCQIYTYNK